MQEDRVYDNLLNLPLFLGMSRNDLLEVAGHTKFDFQKAEKGLTIVKEGEPCTRLYFLLTGELNVITEADDHGYRIEEDIKAPESFEIERRLVEELNIPVMHDDQHGTAIISSAALLNAVELAGKKMEEVKMVISGAGSAAIACANLYVSFGVKPENVVMFNSKGALRKDDPRVTDMQRRYATDKHYDDLAHAMKGADVFIG